MSLLLLLLGCGGAGNHLSFTPGSGLSMGPVQTALWWEPEGSGAALYLSSVEFGCEALRGGEPDDAVLAGPVLSAWFTPVEGEPYEGSYRAGMYGWSGLWDDVEPAAQGTFWVYFSAGGEGVDAIGGVGTAEVEVADAAVARGHMATALLEASFETEVCEPGWDIACEPTEEICNGVDDDCDGEVDEGLVSTLYRDDDGDGHGSGEAEQACTGAEHYSELPDDCNDADPTMFPGNVEQCNGTDDDCDGYVDEGAC